MGSKGDHHRQLVDYCQDQLSQLQAEAGLLLDLRDPLGFRLAVNVSEEASVRAALCKASRAGSFAVLCIGIPRPLARAMVGNRREALEQFDRLSGQVLPVIVVSTGGCSLTFMPRDRASPSLN